MESNHIIFAGMDISHGRRPVTCAALGHELEVEILAKWEISEAVACLKEYENARLVVNVPVTKPGQEILKELLRSIKSAGFKPYSNRNDPRRWIKMTPHDFFGVFQPVLFPQRSLEGRIQRALILHEEGLRIDDPMDFFEEITRHKLMQGSLPNENIYSIKELNALAAAYAAWLSEKHPERASIRGDSILPAGE